MFTDKQFKILVIILSGLVLLNVFILISTIQISFDVSNSEHYISYRMDKMQEGIYRINEQVDDLLKERNETQYNCSKRSEVIGR